MAKLGFSRLSNWLKSESNFHSLIFDSSVDCLKKNILVRIEYIHYGWNRKFSITINHNAEYYDTIINFDNVGSVDVNKFVFVCGRKSMHFGVYVILECENEGNRRKKKEKIRTLYSTTDRE